MKLKRYVLLVCARVVQKWQVLKKKKKKNYQKNEMCGEELLVFICMQM
jgi:hypothetical protein